jgi:hypothetical protein
MIAELNLNTRQTYQPFYDGVAAGWCVPPNTAPNVGDLRNRIAQRVSKPGCSKFISDLINGTATATNPAEFTDALKGFNEIASSNQKGVVYGDTIMKTYGFAGGTIFGSIGTHTAQIELSTPYPTPVGLSRQGLAQYRNDQANIQAGTALHETLHLAGKYGYSDYAFAKTVAAMQGVKPPNFTDIRQASDYWNRALDAACNH